MMRPFFLRWTPDESAHARDEFGDRKWFCQIVVGARVQTFHALLDEAACSEHQDRSIDLPITQQPADLKPAAARQADIENDAVITGCTRHLDRLLAGIRKIDGIGILTQRTADEVRDAAFIFDNQDSHGWIIEHATSGPALPCWEINKN